MKTALITGANRGLGRALAFEFGERGYELILHSRKEKCFSRPTGAQIVLGDLDLIDTVREIEDVCESVGGLTVLVNNAGIYLNSTFANTSIGAIIEMITVNLIAPMILTNALWPFLRANGQGGVININSIAGKQGAPNEVAYCAAKHGLKGFSDALQFDATKDGIRVLDVCIGAMKTDMAKAKVGFENFIEPEDAARAIVSLYEAAYGNSLRIPEVLIARGNY